MDVPTSRETNLGVASRTNVLGIFEMYERREWVYFGQRKQLLISHRGFHPHRQNRDDHLD